MAKLWPGFSLTREGELFVWKGSLRGGQRFYSVGVAWLPHSPPPLVFVLDPKIAPREGGTFDEIPHLYFNEKEPADSALCLFNSVGNEWNTTLMIADTTIPWAARWLLYYELWLVDGVWRGGGIGFESRASARAASINK